MAGTGLAELGDARGEYERPWRAAAVGEQTADPHIPTQGRLRVGPTRGIAVGHAAGTRHDTVVRRDRHVDGARVDAEELFLFATRPAHCARVMPPMHRERPGERD